jgi:hypothetical protein
MTSRSLLFAGLSSAVVLVVATVVFVVRRPAYRQTAKQVVIRVPGDRLLGPPEPVAPEALKDLEFAWLSQDAYQKITSADTSQSAPACAAPAVALSERGWTRWPDFPDAALQEKIVKSHLRIEVWVNSSRATVAVAFGGTVFTSLKDWQANLRWFIPMHNDEYTKVVKEVGPRFVDEFLTRKQQPEWAFLVHATIYSTGHSPGGGLAQEFAYSLPINSGVPRVAQVFAFDPSPVTGYSSVDTTTRDFNKKDLRIDRIYERGEILATLRSLTNFIDPPKAVSPVIRQVRYNLFSRKPITGHSISELACELEKATHF